MVRKKKKIKHSQGHRKKIIKDSGLRRLPSQSNILLRAISFHQAGRLHQAEVLYRQILQTQPNHPEALNYLGMLSYQRGNNEIAVELINKALSNRPDYVNAHKNLGNILSDLGKLDEAVASYRRALALKPNDAVAHNNLGNALRDQGKIDEAVFNFRQAFSLNPDFAEPHYNLGLIFRESGQMDDAIACFRRAISLKPDYAAAYKNLSSIVRYTEVDDVIHAMDELYNNKDIPDADRIIFGFALGKAFENIGDYEKAFDFILEANHLKRKSYKYSIQQDHDFFERIKKIFSPDFFASHNGSGSQERTPVFIIGMPRSGTTLVEQILASHSLVFGAGELNILMKQANSISNGKATAHFPECMLDLNRDALVDIGADYTGKTREISKDAEYITDKLPYNFQYVGFIKAILPKAKVIHCMRNPMDNCFSIFKTDFDGEHGYAYDMNELGRYYNSYRDLMAHWEEVLPGFLFTIKYEKMISDQKNQTRKLLDFCDLPWEEGCLTFHKTERIVTTASFAQVRQPIYKDSVELWKQYEKQLEPLRKAIDAKYL